MDKGSILITGCGSGLGNHWLKLFLRQGEQVIGLTRNPQEIDEELKSHPNLTLVQCDIGNVKNIQSIDEQILSQVEVLINNAGYGQVGPLLSQTNETIKKQFQVNLFGLIELTNRIVPFMRSFPKPKIIMIGSSSGQITSPFNGVYSASKHALEAITDAYRFELRPLNIQVTCLQLGKLHTAYNQRAKSICEKHLETVLPELKRSLIQFNRQFDNQNGQSVEAFDRKIGKLIRSQTLFSRYIWDHYSRLLFLIKRLTPRAIYEWLQLRKNHL